MRSSESIDKIAPALLAVWKELEYVQKDSDSPQGYKYVSDLVLTSLCHPALAKQSLMLVPVDAITTYEHVANTSGGAKQYRCDAIATYALIHTSGQWFHIEVAGSAIGTDKQTTSALTACHKLACRQLLMLATGEDNEKPPNAEQRATMFDGAMKLTGEAQRIFVKTNWKKFTKEQQTTLAAKIRGTNGAN